MGRFLHWLLFLPPPKCTDTFIPAPLTQVQSNTSAPLPATLFFSLSIKSIIFANLMARSDKSVNYRINWLLVISLAREVEEKPSIPECKRWLKRGLETELPWTSWVHGWEPSALSRASSTSWRAETTMTFLLSCLDEQWGTKHTLLSQLILLPCIPPNNSQCIHNSRNWCQQSWLRCHGLPELSSLNPRAKFQTRKGKEKSQYKTPPSKNLQITAPHMCSEEMLKEWRQVRKLCFTWNVLLIPRWRWHCSLINGTGIFWSWEGNSWPAPWWSLLTLSPAQVPHGHRAQGSSSGSTQEGKALLNNLGIKASVSIIMNTW